MDKITRQVRIEHWTQIMNECLNSGMNKTDIKGPFGYHRPGR